MDESVRKKFRAVGKQDEQDIREFKMAVLYTSQAREVTYMKLYRY